MAARDELSINNSDTRARRSVWASLCPHAEETLQIVHEEHMQGRNGRRTNLPSWRSNSGTAIMKPQYPSLQKLQPLQTNDV